MHADKIEWITDIESSNIDAVAWDDHNLFIRFNSGGTYKYKNVPRHVYDGILSAPSAGSYVHQYVINVYDYERLG